MINGFGFAIESLVAVLLLLTIGYCFVLNKRLTRFRADEQMLKATIGELITATEIAERAIAGLKLTVRECDSNLGERLRTAERFMAEMGTQIETGDVILKRLIAIAGAAQPAAPITMPEPAAPDPLAIVAAARALADRSRSRAGALAA